MWRWETCDGNHTVKRIGIEYLQREKAGLAGMCYQSGVKMAN